jgi:hypothetical protein
MAGLLGMAMPTGGGLLDMAAAPAKAKEAKKAPAIGSKEFERDMLELQKLKGDAQYGVSVPEYLDRYLELQEKYGLGKGGKKAREWIKLQPENAPQPDNGK